MDQNQPIFNTNHINQDEFFSGIPCDDYSLGNEFKLGEYSSNYSNQSNGNPYSCYNHSIVNNNNNDNNNNNNNIDTTQPLMPPCVNDQHSQCPVLTSPSNWDQNYSDIPKSHEFHQINHQNYQIQSAHNILDINKPIELFPMRHQIPGGYEIIIQPTCSPFVDNYSNGNLYSYYYHPIVNNDNNNDNNNIDTIQPPMPPCVNDQHSQCPVLTSPFTPPNWDQNYSDIPKSHEFHQINHQNYQIQSVHNNLDINKPIELFPMRHQIPGGYEIIIQPTCSPFVDNTQNYIPHYYEQNNISDNSQFNQLNSYDSEIFNNCYN
ncbi:hypothetical protein RclHR1_00750010 [Rhizophagus clarus]|uniref:Uncharacterized protein n=1 Tax=Rhizophagus clarus TaxID=94130 RepID=A0A2Z6RWY0_9GLOM|nr:hypothetical protein RclHR1_00750010 [Rhizophagus clarus]GES85860.1 hypothetical protein GLOIN_2v1548249 [Rhizophagus clarus]